ncbi:hypothetical protein I3843_09G086700 [Carya illinoinensis]|uniref:C2H2-type domain-containing protein n=1 Tax=Carya illinoinensis TaxID=32201 RepID=A0A922E2D8_CARIL|nr:hypothetical protein I3842_09G086000 [Carya illinoinensis]KAG7962834.1 hypothetical protein I3843_09G086700 [Carya illinoinensis]
MRHLFGTWSAVFPPSVLHKIEVQLQFSPSVNQQSSGLNPLRASESPRPSHGIHVNPKYLRQFEHSAVDSNIQQARGTSAVKMFGKKPAIGFDEFDSGQAELVPSQVGAERLSSTGNAGNAPFAFGANKVRPPSTIRLGRPSSPSRTRPDRSLSLAVEEFAADHSPRRFVGGGSPAHPVYDIDNKVATPSWQNTEEEEFDWEDMSPTLADSNRSNDFLPRTRPGIGVQSASPLNAGQAHLPAVDDSSVNAEDSVPLLSQFGRGSMRKISGFQAERNQILDPRYPHEAWNLPPHLSKGRGRNYNLPLLASRISSSDGDKMPSLIDKLPDADPQLHGPPTIISRFGSSNLDSIGVEARSTVLPASRGVRPSLNVHNSRPPYLQHIFPQQRVMGGQFESINTSNAVNNLGPNGSLHMPELQSDGFRNRELSSTKLPQLPNQHRGLIHVNQRNQVQGTPLQPQFLPSQEAHPSLAAVVQPHLVAPPYNRGYSPQMHGSTVSTVLSNPVTGIQLMLPVQNIPSSLHLQGGALPPLPPGAPPTSSHMIPFTQNAVPAVANQQTNISGLIGSLMAQGFISLTKQTPIQDSVGVEFNVDLLKVRHETAISSLYADLPRQCTTCGLRFKCQEEHSRHMDWHVTKNRMSKNRKQKPSRKWFVSSSMWLSGAEALGTEAVPGFLPTEIIVEKKDDEEMAVPADEDQNACALCGEPFDDFYSDETEEWMYKGAVYLNAPCGSTAGMDRSQLGPIVHAKCRSESSAVSTEGFRQDEGGITAEGSQSKRMRLS